MPLDADSGSVEMQSTSDNARSSRRFKQILIPVLTVVTISAAWELYVRIVDVPRFIVPPPLAVLGEMVSGLGRAWPNISTTTVETLWGFGASILVGVPLAVLLVSFRPLEMAIYPLLVSSQVVPKVAIAPIFLVWWGFGIFPKIMVIFLITFFPIVISTAIGLKATETDTIHLAQTMGVTKLQQFWRFRMPNALPTMFGGLKLAATLAVVGAVVAEFVGADSGLGYAIVRANARLDTVEAFAAMGYLTLMGIALYGIVELIEKAALPWHVSQRQPELGMEI